jgi:hypothetical protein
MRWTSRKTNRRMSRTWPNNLSGRQRPFFQMQLYICISYTENWDIVNIFVVLVFSFVTVVHWFFSPMYITSTLLFFPRTSLKWELPGTGSTLFLV